MLSHEIASANTVYCNTIFGMCTFICVRSFIHSFIHSFIRSLNRLFVRAYIHSYVFVCLFCFVISFVHNTHVFFFISVVCLCCLLPLFMCLCLCVAMTFPRLFIKNQIVFNDILNYMFVEMEPIKSGTQKKQNF